MKTTINGKEVSIYNRNEIMGVFTQFVQIFLKDGYQFYSGEATRGSQGEETKLALTKDNGKTVFLIYMDRGYERDSENEYRNNDYYSIKIEKFNDVNPNRTCWLGRGELYLEEKFYWLDDYYHADAFTRNISILKEVHKIQRERIKNKTQNNSKKELPVSAYAKALVLVKKVEGYKRMTLDKIQRVCFCRNKDICYYEVYFNNGKRTLMFDTNNSSKHYFHSSYAR